MLKYTGHISLEKSEPVFYTLHLKITKHMNASILAWNKSQPQL